MPIKLNDTVIIGDDGKFTGDFEPSMLGDQYKDSKFFETTPDVVSLMKSAVDSKSALGKKLESVIQKPGKDATPEQIAEYNKQLKKELGAPESVDAYQFDPVEGIEEDKEYAALVKEAFLAEGVPATSAANIAKKVNAFMKQRAEAAQKELLQAFENDVKVFKENHKGDTLVTGARTALKAMVQFGTPEFVKAVKDSKVLSNPSDMNKLRDLGIWPSQLAIWENIGTSMKSDAAITDEGNPVQSKGDVPKEGTTEAVVHKAYDHPTSVADRKARGKQY